MSDSVTPWTVACQAPLSMEFSRPEYWSGWPCPPPGDLPNPGIKPDLLHFGWIPYHLSHQGSSRTMEWVAYPFSRGSSWPRNRTGVSCIAVRFFASWATREAQIGEKEQVQRGRKGDKKKLKIKLSECCILKKSREQEFQEREWVCCVHWCRKVV